MQWTLRVMGKSGKKKTPTFPPPLKWMFFLEKNLRMKMLRTDEIRQVPQKPFLNLTSGKFCTSHLIILAPWEEHRCQIPLNYKLKILQQIRTRACQNWIIRYHFFYLLVTPFVVCTYTFKLVQKSLRAVLSHAIMSTFLTQMVRHETNVSIQGRTVIPKERTGVYVFMTGFSISTAAKKTWHQIVLYVKKLNNSSSQMMILQQ